MLPQVDYGLAQSVMACCWGHTSAHRSPGTLELLNTQGPLLSGGGEILAIPPRKLGVDIADGLMTFCSLWWQGLTHLLL